MVLDVGAGLGTLSDYLAQKFKCSMTSLEINPSRKLENLVVADGCSLPFTNASFDLVISSDVLEHVAGENRIIFLQELLRCCKLGVVFTYSKLHRGNTSQSGIRIFEKVCRSKPDWYLEHNSMEIVDEKKLFSALGMGQFKFAELRPLAGVFTLFFTSLQCVLRFPVLSLFLNIGFYMVTRLLDPPPFYSFGATAKRR